MNFQRTDTAPVPAILLLVSSEDLVTPALERLGISPDETITLDAATVWDRRWREADKQKVYVAVLTERLYTQYTSQVWITASGMPDLDWSGLDDIPEYHRQFLALRALGYFFGNTLIDANGDTQSLYQPDVINEFDVILTETAIDAYLNKFENALLVDPYDAKNPVPPGGGGGLLDQMVATPPDGDDNLI
jgi:hypothetical protein